MTRRNSNGRVKPYKWIGHMEVYFNEEEATAVLVYWTDRTFVLGEAIVELTQGEMPVKISYDPDRDGYRCSLQPKSKHCSYRGYTIGFSHSSLSRLLQVALYVKNEMIEHNAIAIPTKDTMPDL